MEMFTRLASWWLRRSSGTTNPHQWFIDWVGGGDKSASGITISQTEALRDVVTATCVAIRAGDLAKLPVHVMRRRKDGGAEIMRDHPFEKLLRKPNSWQSKFEFFEMMQACYLLKSNAYAPIRRNGRGQPIALIPVNPDRVTLNESPDGDLFYHVTRSGMHERAVLRDLPEMIAEADVLHLRGMSLNGLLGLSRIGLARDAIGLSRALERYSSQLFANGARPSGVLETDKKLGDSTFKRFTQQWKESYSGLENAGKTPILEEGLHWKTQTMTSVEAQTIDARRLQMEQTATAFDVPLHRLGIIPTGGGPAILQAHQMYLNNTLSTDAERWENKLNDMFGLDGEESYVEFDLDYFNRADMQTRFTALRTGVIGSFLRINEARRREGLPDVEGGDVLLQPTNMAPFPFVPPAPASGPGPGSDTTGAPADGGDGDPTAVQDVSAPKMFDDFLDRLTNEGNATRDVIRDLHSVVRAVPPPVVNISNTPPTVNVSAPPVNVHLAEQTFHVHEGETKVDVHVPEQSVPVVNVAAPIVNVEQPEIHVAAPTVNVEQPAVTVQAPVVNVAAPQAPPVSTRTKKTRVTEHDDRGRVLETITTEEVG